MLRNKTTYGPIAIDIGATGIKMLQLGHEAGKPKVLAAVHRRLHLAPDDAGKPEVTVKDAIREALGQAPFVGREAVCALGTAEFEMKSLRLPKMPPEDLASAVEFEARDRFDLQGKPAQYRHLVAGEVRHGNEIKQEVIVFAAREDHVAQRLELLESVRLVPIAVDLAPLAVARAFMRFLRRAEDGSAVNMFVDIGWRAAHVIITHGTEIAFIKQVEGVGGHHLTEATAAALNLDPRRALELRVKRMQSNASRRANDQSPVNQEIHHAVGDAVRPLVDKLLKEVQLCLRYFAVTFRGQRPECVTLVGGESSDPAILGALGKELDVACMVGHPLRGVGNAAAVGPRDDFNYQPAWSVACGLALRGSQWVQPVSTGLAERSAATA